MNRIRELRQAAGMKQDWLADLLHVKRQVVSKYELGAVDISTDTLRRLCEIFGVTADYLLGFSSRRENAVREDDAALLSAFHAAPDNIRSGILTTLQPYFEQETLSALPDGTKGDKNGAF